MKLKEILSEIKSFDIYSTEEWEEYINSFEKSEELKEYVNQSCNNGTILKRIKDDEKTELSYPDFNISQKILKSNLFCSSENKYIVGVVSGCYDLLHLGHARSMKYAKDFINEYDKSKLCVLTLSDENIKKKKGENKPILNINERLEMISGIKCIDYVIPLDDPNCINELENIKPNYFFKTSPDKSQEIVKKEIELVEAYDGKIVIIPSGSGRSTTKIINNVLERIFNERN